MTPLDKLLDQVEWIAYPERRCPAHNGVLWATHEGLATVAGVELRVYQLSDGQRVFDAEDLAEAFPGLFPVTP